MEQLDQKQINQLLQSPQGQALKAMLEQAGTATLRQAAEAAVQGDYARVRTVLQPILDRQGQYLG